MFANDESLSSKGAGECDKVQKAQTSGEEEGKRMLISEKYCVIEVHVDVKKIVRGKHFVRPVEKNHECVKEFKKILLNGEYGQNQCFLSVCIIGMEREKWKY